LRNITIIPFCTIHLVLVILFENETNSYLYCVIEESYDLDLRCFLSLS
jgi:hypothetical protein